MPLHWGEYLLTQRVDFTLPEHLVLSADFVREKLSANEKPAPYKEIAHNKWVSRPRLLGAAVPVCLCEPESGCRDGCINRMMQYICDPKFCPCKEQCTNGRLGLRPIPKAEVVKVRPLSQARCPVLTFF